MGFLFFTDTLVVTLALTVFGMAQLCNPLASHRLMRGGLQYSFPMTCRTVVAQDLLQLYDSLKLTSPTMALSAFLKGIAEAVDCTRLQDVSGVARHASCLVLLRLI